MPPTLDQPVIADEPEALHEKLDNPVFDDSNIKAMAAKFKAELPSRDAKKPDQAPPPPPTPEAKPKTDPAPAPVPQPPLDKEAVDDVKIDANTPVTRDHFKRLAQARDSYKEQAEKYRKEQEAISAKAKQLEDELLKTKSALPPNLEEVQKALQDSKRIADENKTLTERLETINLERSPRFQNWWNSETAKHIKVAQAHVPADKREEFAKLLLAPSSPERNAELDAIIEPLPPTSKRLATGALEQVESLKIQRDEALTRGSERWKELQAHEQAEAQKAEQQKQVRLRSLTEESLRRAKAGYTAFQPVGDPAKDAEIASREAFIRAGVAGKLDEDTMLNILPAAVEMLHLRETVIPNLKAENAKQAELIKQLQGSNPGNSNGKSVEHKAMDTDADKSGSSFAQRVSQLMRK